MKSFSFWRSADFLPNGKFRAKERNRILEILDGDEGAVREIETAASSYFAEEKGFTDGYESPEDIAKDLDALVNSIKAINAIIDANGSARALFMGELAVIGGPQTARRFDDLFSQVSGSIITTAAERAVSSNPPRHASLRKGAKPSGGKAARLQLAISVSKIAKESGIEIKRKNKQLDELLSLVYSALGIEDIDPDGDIREVMKRIML